MIFISAFGGVNVRNSLCRFWTSFIELFDQILNIESPLHKVLITFLSSLEMLFNGLRCLISWFLRIDLFTSIAWFNSHWDIEFGISAHTALSAQECIRLFIINVSAIMALLCVLSTVVAISMSSSNNTGTTRTDNFVFVDRVSITVFCGFLRTWIALNGTKVACNTFGKSHDHWVYASDLRYGLNLWGLLLFLQMSLRPLIFTVSLTVVRLLCVPSYELEHYILSCYG